MKRDIVKIENNLGYIRVSILDMSQKDLEKQTGISRQFISDFELGNKIPSLKQALLLAEVANCSVNDIFKLKKSM